MENCKNQQELLKYIAESGIIDLAYVQEQIEMNERKELLEKHPYKIWEGKDGYWRTYLPDRKRGRRLVKKKYEDDIKKAVIDYWSLDAGNTFKERFEVWMERQKKCGRSDNTIYKYECDYARFFEGDEFEYMNVVNISEEDISEFIMRVLKRKAIPYRALKGVFGYMGGVFNKCIKDRIIKENPCEYVDLPLFRSHCAEQKIKSAKERTLSTSEKQSLTAKLDEYRQKNPQSVVPEVVELALYTGMRVGELVALKWIDVDDDEGTLTICRSEKHNRKTGEYYVSSTKNGKIRTIPLTGEMRDVLQRTKEKEIKYGYFGEFIFQNNTGRIRAHVISSYVSDSTKTEDFVNRKSVHAIRRTINSNLRTMGVPVMVAASLLGHSEEVNTKNYTYDVSSMEQKSIYLEKAGRIQ